MNKIFRIILSFCVGAISALSQTPSVSENPLLRRYHDGEMLVYQMKATNEAWHYEIQADGVVKKDSTGRYFEEFRWSNFVSDRQNLPLTSASADFRQRLSLDLNRGIALQNLSQVDPKLVGPITDLMTFYADLWLGAKLGKLSHAGDHFYYKGDATGTWADGTYILTGEDSIDFDLTLRSINRSDNTATLIVRHVPPENPKVKFAAEWMHKAVADTPNNWVQVQKTQDGKFLAGVGKETFDVQMKINLADGKILSGTLDNPLQTIERECQDAALTQCGDPRPHPIRRHVEISLRP